MSETERENAWLVWWYEWGVPNCTRISGAAYAVLYDRERARFEAWWHSPNRGPMPRGVWK